MEPCGTPPPELSLHNRYDPLTQRSVVGWFGVFLTSFRLLLTQIRPTVRLNQWEDWLNWWEREVLLCLWLQRPWRFIDGEILPDFPSFPIKLPPLKYILCILFSLYFILCLLTLSKGFYFPSYITLMYFTGFYVFFM